MPMGQRWTLTEKKIMERREAEGKAYEKMMAEWESNRKKRKADFEKRMAKRKANGEEVAARLEAIHDKKDDNQMSLETETEHQKKMDAWIADMKDGRKERMTCQEAMEANPEKMEPNPGEKEAAVEQQENPNEEVTILFLREC
jgi:hypothetical protein